jgi:hypothetical protein
MQSRDKTNWMLWSLTGLLALTSSVAIILLINQQAKNANLRHQLTLSENRLLQSNQSARPSNGPTNLNAHATTFADLPENAVAGRYKLNDYEDHFVTLHPDHTFSNHKTEKLSGYRWELSGDGLILKWQRGTSRFNAIESPGVYVGGKTRLEKVE